jgi:signal transduction histidine kinase
LSSERAEGHTELSESMSEVLRRLAVLWGGACVVKVPFGNGAVAASSSDKEWPSTLPTMAGPPVVLTLEAQGQVLGALELAQGEAAPTPEQQAAARAVAAALAVALLAEQKRRDAEKESQAKDEIVAALAHDLRSPLNAITGWCHMLQTGSLGPEQRDNAVEIIARNARAQGQLIGDVADLARLLADSLPLEWATVDASAAVREAVKGLDAQAQAKTVTLEAVTPPEAAPVRADADRFTQVARLLLSHALKVSKQRGRVTAHVTPTGASVELAVEAAGAGLAPEAVRALFDVENAPGASRRPGSLGLELVRRLVQLQGGTVSAESQGPGTALRLVATFPQAPAGD